MLLAGGLFYNVKLNNSLAKIVNHICICPLAGDQGAAIGMYEFYNPNTFDFSDLCIGLRHMKAMPKFIKDYKKNKFLKELG